MTPEEAATRREERRRAIEPGRLSRMLGLKCDRLPTGPGQYAVSSSVPGKVYYVDINRDIPCDCPDAQYRDFRCKHQLLVALHECDPKMMQAVNDLLARIAAIQAENLRQSRAKRRARAKAGT